MTPHNFDPKTHIFLWDLHEVILERNMRSWARICLTFDRKWELIKHLNKKSIIIFLTCILDRLKIIKKQMVSEELVQAAQTTGNDALVQLIIEVCSAYTPIQDTVQLIQELSALGYTHHLGSNIGKTVFDNCVTKFPAIFTIFKGHSIPFDPLKAKMIKKPHPDFFTTHIRKYNLNPAHVIFIDDKLINVQAAQSVGIHGIHFQNTAQLRDQLIKYNILNDE